MDWDERYRETGYVYGTEPNDFLRQVYQEIPGKRVLCLAEGEGRNAVFLARKGFDVTALDSSAVGLEKARRLAVENNVEITTQQADLANYDFEPNSWHAIVSIFCHLPMRARQRLHAQISDALVYDGIFILEAYTPEQIRLGTGGPPTADLTMTASALEKELSGLGLKINRELERDVIEGRYHTGRGSVVQVLGYRA